VLRFWMVQVVVRGCRYPSFVFCGKDRHRSDWSTWLGRMTFFGESFILASLSLGRAQS
jgi:hypothetical protein